MNPTEGIRIQGELIARGCLRGFRIELPFQFSLGLLQSVEKVRADGEQVRSGQAHNLVHVAEAGTHHLSREARSLVVVVNADHGRDAGVLVRRELRAAVLLSVPVADTADEWRDESHSRVGAPDRLGKAEEQSQMAVNPLLLQPPGCTNTVLGAGELDENAVTADAFGRIKRNEFTGLFDAAFGIEAQTSGDLRGHTPRDRLQSLASK